MILRPYISLAAAALLSISASGCLSLGGSTTYVEESPDTKARIESLEIRVSELENMRSAPNGPTYLPPPAH